jgi:UDP-N-acetylglucosamine enolpyruvyl transferase
MLAGRRQNLNRPAAPAVYLLNSTNKIGNIPMFRTSVCLAALLLVSGAFVTASAETTAPVPQPKMSRVKLTVEHLKEMRAKWILNRPKLRACRKEVKSKGLEGDDRWFYIEDCMARI